MKRKVLIVLSFLIVILTTTVMATNILPDTDNRVIMLKQNGVLIGDENGNLNLDQTLKRQEMVVLISRLMGKEEEAKNWNTSSLTFLDVSKDNWAAGYIAWAKDNSITKGYSDEWFGYDDSLTTTQTQIFLLRVLGNLEAEIYNANQLSNEIGLTKDITNDGQEQILRSDVAIMLFNTLEIEKNTQQRNVFYNAGNSVISIIDKAYEEYKNIPQITNKGKSKLNVKLNTQMTDKYKEAEKLNGMEATLSSSIDIKKEIMQMALNLKQNSNQFVDGEMIIDSENLYFKIKDIIDNYIYDSVEYNIFAEYATGSIGNEESIILLKDIYDNVKLDIIDILTQEKINKQEVKTLINGKEVFATKNSIIMNQKLEDKLMLVMYEAMVKNNDFINFMVETNNAQYESWGEWGEQFIITAEELKEELQSEINKLDFRIIENNYDENDDEILLNIYTVGLLNKPVKYEIEDSYYNEKYALVLFDGNIEFNYYDSYSDYTTEEISIRLNKKDETKWYFEFSINEYMSNKKANNQLLISADINIQKDVPTNNIAYGLNIIEANYDISIIEYSESIYNSNGLLYIREKITRDNNMDLGGVFEINRNGNKASIEFYYEYDENCEIDDNYKENAIYYENIDEQEWNEIQEKIDNISLKFVPFSSAMDNLYKAIFSYEDNVVKKAKESVFKNDIRSYQEQLTIKMYKLELEGKDYRTLNATSLSAIKSIIPEFKNEYDGVIKIVNGKIKKGEKSYIYEEWLDDLGIK